MQCTCIINVVIKPVVKINDCILNFEVISNYVNITGGVPIFLSQTVSSGLAVLQQGKDNTCYEPTNLLGKSLHRCGFLCVKVHVFGLAGPSYLPCQVAWLSACVFWPVSIDIALIFACDCWPLFVVILLSASVY